MRSSRSRMLCAALVVAACFTLMPALQAQEDGSEKEAATRILTLLEGARISMADAIKLAEETTGGKAVEAELELEGGRLLFEVETVVGGDAPHLEEVVIDASTGKVVVGLAEGKDEESAEDDDDEGEDDDDDGEGAEDDDEGEDEDESGAVPPGPSDRAFTDTFPVDPEDLASSGTSRYFVLEPNYRLVLGRTRGDRVYRLTITVLDETRVVDGVETRVVEEREVVDGKEKELSRNYFAISRKTGDVYYFGEDAGGAWEAGKNGARFGLIMPGSPLLGARHYQEVAPGVALDRAEVVSLSETVETPAGTFQNCLKVEESTPLEPGESEFKLYAPGVGLIYDEGMTLLEYGEK